MNGKETWAYFAPSVTIRTKDSRFFRVLEVKSEDKESRVWGRVSRFKIQISSTLVNVIVDFLFFETQNTGFPRIFHSKIYIFLLLLAILDYLNK